MRDKWAFKYINFNNFSTKKAKEKQIKKVKREIKAKKAREVPKPPEITVSKEKDQVIRSLQSRWWYVIPDWPDKSLDYTPSLIERGLKIVQERDWPMEIVKDETIKDRVKPIRGFPGLFQNRRGRIYDLREKSTCPSYHTLAEKTETELDTLLQAALQNQLKQLQEQPGYDQILAGRLEERIKMIEIKAEKLENETENQGGAGENQGETLEKSVENVGGGAEIMEGVEESIESEDNQECDEPMDLDEEHE